jgi:hypothetical protein
MMGSWISPNTHTGVPEPELDVPIEVNGYTFKRPSYFKNKAYARAFEIALVLAQKKPLWSGVTILDTTECIDIIMFRGVPEIQLKLEVTNPRKVAHDAMKLVPMYFDKGIVRLSQKKNGRREWFIELIRN